MPDKSYIFVIDTEQYSGNFERQMCAFITGQIGDCGTGDEEAREAKPVIKEHFGNDPFEFIIEQRDDEGCYRPCDNWATPGWFNNNIGGHFRQGEEGLALKYYQEKCLEAMEECRPDDKDGKERWLESSQAKKLQKWPAYLSVGIFFYKKPCNKIIEFMKERAYLYAKEYPIRESYCSKGKSLTITGFRLIEEELKQSEEEI